ncbi:MAG: bifunctional glutamate N-acetyltransferase/amino-acid acetyltransferase ArgJ [Bauldia sp.]
MGKISPLAPASFPAMPAIPGVRMATAAAGIRYKGREDVLVMLFDKGTTVAGVFTTSKCPSAAVDWCREVVAGGKARALMVNSGNANAFTGKKGKAATRLSADLLAKAGGFRKGEIFLCSTGVIGEPLPAEKFGGVVDGLVAGAEADRWEFAARAIMTTDTFPKGATATADLGGVTVTINGIAKGAGMIAPDMATMLSFVATDAAIAAPVLQALLSEGVKDSFNAMTIDGDTSTSDTLLAFATGKAKNAPIAEPADPRLRPFRKALDAVLLDLAKQVARDGEGATKFAEIRVEGAVSKRSARKIALSIANSPLVKTALAGEDANWGRVVMAVGKAGEPADRDRLAIWFGDIRVAVEGERDPAYSEAATSAYMKNQEVVIKVDLGLGRGKDRVFTCDLTKEYVAINGDYRS